MYLCIHVSMCLCIYVSMYVCQLVCMSVSLYACLYVNVNVIYIYNIYIIYIYTVHHWYPLIHPDVLLQATPAPLETSHPLVLRSPGLGSHCGSRAPEAPHSSAWWGNRGWYMSDLNITQLLGIYWYRDKMIYWYSDAWTILKISRSHMFEILKILTRLELPMQFQQILESDVQNLQNRAFTKPWEMMVLSSGKLTVCYGKWPKITMWFTHSK